MPLIGEKGDDSESDRQSTGESGSNSPGARVKNMQDIIDEAKRKDQSK